MGSATSKRTSTGRSIRPTLTLVGSAVMIAAGGYLAVTGLLNKVTRVPTQVGSALDPTAELQALTGVPGESEGQLTLGTYQVIGIGPDLTETRTQPDSVNGQAVVRRSISPPSITVTGPDGKNVRIGSPTVNYVIDMPGADAASLVEFTVGAEGSYRVSAQSAGDGSVELVGFRRRDDVGEVVRDTSVDTGKLLLGGVIASLGAALLLLGRKSRSAQRRADAVAPTGKARTTSRVGSSVTTSGTRTPIVMQSPGAAAAPTRPAQSTVQREMASPATPPPAAAQPAVPQPVPRPAAAPPPPVKQPVAPSTPVIPPPPPPGGPPPPPAHSWPPAQPGTSLPPPPPPPR